MRDMASADPAREIALSAPGAAGVGRAAWRAPTLTRLPINQTLLGGSVGNEGNGVFAFTEGGPPP